MPARRTRRQKKTEEDKENVLNNVMNSTDAESMIEEMAIEYEEKVKQLKRFRATQSQTIRNAFRCEILKLPTSTRQMTLNDIFAGGGAGGAIDPFAYTGDNVPGTVVNQKRTRSTKPAATPTGGSRARSASRTPSASSRVPQSARRTPRSRGGTAGNQISSGADAESDDSDSGAVLSGLLGKMNTGGDLTSAAEMIAGNIEDYQSLFSALINKAKEQERCGTEE